MNPKNREDLLKFLDQPHRRRLWAAARDKIERLGAVRGRIQIDHPTAAERRAFATLVGSPEVPPASLPLRMPLSKLDGILRQSRFAVGLEEALRLHGGELQNRPAEKAAKAEAWKRFWNTARCNSVIEKHPELSSWLEEIEHTGLYRQLEARRASSSPNELLERVLRVLGELLPQRGGAGVRLPVLANRILGDSHALDVGHRVPALVLRALASIHRQPFPRSALERRQLWALAGVICDDLSCDVLVSGLATPGDGLLQRFLREHAAAGEPVRITLRQLSGASPVVLPTARRVFVCENPAVLSAAADHLGQRCAPLVCLAGNPDTAALLLLRSLVQGGSQLFYHGDFDWGGLRIANTLLKNVPFTPWHFMAKDYLQATQDALQVTLDERAVDAEWDPDLRPAMENKGVAVEEESVIDTLLGDLGHSWTRSQAEVSPDSNPSEKISPAPDSTQPGK